MANGTIHQLGTLYIDGNIIPRANKPWGQNIATRPSLGDLHVLDMYGYPKYPNIEIRDSDQLASNRIQWVEVNDGNDKILIADRNLCTNVTYNFLKQNNLNKPMGQGKTINIDGDTYELFMLSAGESTDVQSGTVTTNQWDKYIGNCGGFSGLPTPEWQDMQNYSNINNFSTPHNQIWNWAGCFSWSNYEIKENLINNSSVRGNLGARKWDYYNASFQDQSLGWRPALRVISTNSAPKITPPTKSFGILSQAQNISYSVSEPDNDAYNVTVYVDNNEKESYTNQIGTKNYILELSRYWRELNIGQHQIEIYAIDSKSKSASAIYSFNKANSAPAISPTTKYLGSLFQAPNVVFDVYDADNEEMTIKIKIDSEYAEFMYNQTNGQKIYSMASNWANVSIGYHTLEIIAEDPHGNQGTATYTFDKTNSLPTAPTIISPSSNSRTTTDFYVEFNIGRDPEGDSQTVKVQMARNDAMTNNLQEYTQLEKYNGSSWVAVSGALTNADVGSKFRAHIVITDSTPQYGDKFIRIASFSSITNQYVYSSVIKINVKPSHIEVATKPYMCSTRPEKIIVLLSLAKGNRVTEEITVCNNANESKPTWEIYEPDKTGIYSFKNQENPKSGWAISVNVKVIPNGYNGEISLSAIGLGVL